MTVMPHAEDRSESTPAPCNAISLVGATKSAPGGLFVVLPLCLPFPDDDWDDGDASSAFSAVEMANTSVLPVPARACTTTSTPSRTKGNAFSWTGEGQG